jgi:hypothetical protein
MSTFVFAETCVFGKQSLEPICCSLLALVTLLRHPFFRRYGVNLPSSLTEVRSFTWGEFPLPTGVGVRYGQKDIWLEAFLDGVGLVTCVCVRRLVPTLMLVRSGFASIAHFTSGAHPVHLMGSPP